MQRLTPVVVLCLLIVLGIVHLVTAQTVLPEWDVPIEADVVPNQYILRWHEGVDELTKAGVLTTIQGLEGERVGQLRLIDSWVVQIASSRVEQLRALPGIKAVVADTWLRATGSKGICQQPRCAVSHLIHLLGETPAGVVVLNVNGRYSHFLNQAIAQANTETLFFVTPGGDEQQDACLTSPASSPYVLTIGSDAVTANFGGCIDMVVPGANSEQAVAEIVQSAAAYLQEGMPATAVWAQLQTDRAPHAVCDIRRYVAKTATGANNGSSWVDAHTDLQTALTTITPCPGQQAEIWVAVGIYYPDEGGGQTDNDQTATFTMRDDVAVYGGFSETETSFALRDWLANVTILSGDIQQNDIVGSSGIVTSTANVVGNNSYSVVTASGTNTNSVLDGFTITAGNADGSSNYPNPDRRGGGLYAAAGQLQLVNLRFLGNSALGNGATLGYGGGLYLINGSDASLTNVHIAGNVAGNSGGGIYYSQSNLQMINVLLAGNKALNGGGLYGDLGVATLINATVVSNFADYAGAGLRTIYGSDTTIYNSIFWDNATMAGSSANDTISHAFNSQATLDFNLMQGGCALDNTCSNQVVGDPAFIMPITGTLAPTTAGDFHVDEAVSVVIDAGHDAYVPITVTTDLDGKNRIQGQDVNPTQDVDLGAYEFNLPDLDIMAVIATNGNDLELSWSNEVQACVWTIYRETTPYFTPQFGVNNVGATCTDALCYGSNYTLVGAISDSSENDYVTVRPDECINVFSANTIGVFHFSLQSR